MGIDASIALQYRAPQIDNPLSQLAQFSQIQNAQQQNRLADLAFGEKEREMGESRALNDAYKNALSPDGTLDRAKLTAGAAGAGLGSKLPAIQKGFADQDKAAADALKTKLENGIKEIEFGAQVFSGVRDQASYDQARQHIAQVLGPERAAQMPAVYDPATIEANRMKALAVKDQLAQKWKELEFGEMKRHNVATEGNQAGTLAVAQGNLKVNQEKVQQGKVPAGYRYNAAGDLEAIPGGPAAAKSTEQQKAASDANSVLGLLDMAEPLLKQATNSYAGTAVDKVAQAVGVSTEGAQASAQLKALEGSLVAKMPKMSGPQSDKDVLLYRQMAGQIGDSTVPVETRRAAVKVIRELNQKYVADNGGTPQARVAEAVKSGEVTKLANARPVSVKSAADYAAIPSGTVYMAPDGSMRTKK